MHGSPYNGDCSPYNGDCARFLHALADVCEQRFRYGPVTGARGHSPPATDRLDDRPTRILRAAGHTPNDHGSRHDTGRPSCAITK